MATAMRAFVRMEEMRQSLRIVEQAMKNLPDGLYKTDDRKVSLPPRAELDVSMEAVIHHFKLMTEGLLVPPGMLYQGIESSKGELGYFVYADGSARPYRLHVQGFIQQSLCHRQDEPRRHAVGYCHEYWHARHRARRCR